MLKQIRPALVIFALLTVLTGVIYPAVVTLAQGLFSHEANGSVIEQNGMKVGSELIGQAFDSDDLFWSRPSATSPMAYNGASSTGSNLGPTNPDQIKAVKERVEAIRKAHPEKGDAPIPVDLVTASGSGLDPHISPAAAEYQVARVAKARGLSEDAVRTLVAEHTQGRTLGLLGEPRVNVLKLNLAVNEAIRKGVKQ
jgi:potassium-transporting ATPase KdpC subunit